MLNLNDYFDLKNITPLVIRFNFNIINNIGVSLFIEDKTKHLTKRTLKSNMLSYMGAQLQIDDLKNSYIEKTMISLQQYINSEEDTSKKCTNYPNAKFKSYQECDEKYVYDTIKQKHGVVDGLMVLCHFGQQIICLRLLQISMNRQHIYT